MEEKYDEDVHVAFKIEPWHYYKPEILIEQFTSRIRTGIVRIPICI